MSKTKLISFLDARKSPPSLRLRVSGWSRLLAQTRVEKQSREGGLDEVRAGGGAAAGANEHETPKAARA